MENVFLTSFGVFLALLLKQPPKPTNLQISQAFDIQIEAKEPTPIVHDKKKKNKKKKHNEAKVEETQQTHKKRRDLEESEKLTQAKIMENEQKRQRRLTFVKQQLEAISSYFLQELQTIIPYNGDFGHYILTLPLPELSYSQLSIQWKYDSKYPEQLPLINLNTSQLHPLEKQKLNSVIKEQKDRFGRQENYFYILNLCTAIFEDIICCIQEEEEEKVQKKQPQKKGIHQIDPNKKEIYQNLLEEIFQQYEHEGNKTNQTMIKHHEEHHKKYHSSRGRYAHQFEEIEKIGEGGFGRVYKVKNKVDSNIYAVKKLVINYGDRQSRKMLKEVGFLSKLNHPNIVRYYQSWLEDTTTVDQLISDMSITDKDEIEEFHKLWLQYVKDHSLNQILPDQIYHDEDEDDDSIVFCDDIGFQDNSDIVFGNTSEIQESGQMEMDDHSGINRLNHKSSEVLEFPFKILYVVMEFCSGMNLKDFIQTKFNESNETKVKIIRGMLEGISYIHTRRIIHRDLKPANIFLENNKVKIGDFGLATIGNIENNPIQHHYQMMIEQSQKTKGVGTSFYRAPEQLKSTHYDEKVDIYSLGIIMLQLFYQFGTNMERYQVLTEVTKKHRLPKDFSKFQPDIDHESNIKSCISERPENRPQVQKLLESFRDKYFTQLVSCIANPKHFQFHQLLRHLFNITNESNIMMRQTLFKNYLTDDIIRIYQTHRGVLFTPLSLIPFSSYESLNGMKVPCNRKNKFLLLSPSGILLQCPSNAYISWIEYAKQTMLWRKKRKSEELRRYTFEKVTEYEDVKNKEPFKEKYITAFDITYQNEYNIFYLCESFKISDSIIKTMNLTQQNPNIYLCHSLIFKCISTCFNINENNLNKFLLSISDEKFRNLRNNKLEYMKEFKIEGHPAKKLCSLLDEAFDTCEQLLEEIVKMNRPSQYFDILEEISSIEKISSIFGFSERLKWKLQIPSSHTFGIFWNIGPVKGFTSKEEFSGVLLSNIHIETSLNLGPQESDADVSVWSNGEYLKEDIMQIVAKCWEEGVTAKWYDQSSGEKDLTCRNNIILKKKIERIYFMIRKNMERNLEKKNSEEKEDKESSFVPKESFNYDVIRSLSKDFHKKHSTH